MKIQGSHLGMGIGMARLEEEVSKKGELPCDLSARRWECIDIW